MRIKFSFLAASVALFIILSAASASFAQTEQITGGYGDADVKDKDVIAAAKFAVKKGANKEKATISLINIKQARMQVVAGLNYEVCLEVNVKKSGKKTIRKFAKAVVYRNLKNAYSLTSWTFLKDSAEC